MSLLGNVLWIVMGGLFLSLGYFIGGLILCITIIGIPFGIQICKVGVLALLPFGKEVVSGERAVGCLSTFMNLLWILIGGIWLSLSHLLCAVIFAVTIIGLPFAKQHMKLAALALTPFGKKIVDGATVNKGVMVTVNVQH